MNNNILHKNLLDSIEFPEQFRNLEAKDLPAFCENLRGFIIEAVADNPGHLGASLGTVELTVALHYAFDTPHDKIVWDVGHQAYGHKIITGRKTLFHSNRKYKGISGFPKMSESEDDAFGVGHSSTSISAILGMAMAANLHGQSNRQFIAVIGDGALSGGMAFEALLNAGFNQANILVILNDNNMAIDPVIGASPLQFEKLFQAFDFHYTGPVDGHDVQKLVEVFNQLKLQQGPKVLHVKTVKGKGFRQAELHQTDWHYSPGKFDSRTGEMLETLSHSDKPIKYQDIFGYTLLELATQHPNIVAVTPAMPTGSSLNYMQDIFPNRVFDVGIAEQHAVTFSAGLALEGAIPFCAIYSTFMQRAYDQLIHDVALQKIPVIFCLDRAGLVGADGATHHGAYDLAYLRAVPDLIIASPFDEHELRNLMHTAVSRRELPFVIRYPRGAGRLIDWKNEPITIPVGTGRELKTGHEVAILSLGPIGNTALDAIHQFEQNHTASIGLFDMRFLKPLDIKLLQYIASHYSFIISLEDGTTNGGLGSAIAEYLAENASSVKLVRLGIPDRFIEHGTPDELRKECEMDVQSIVRLLEKLAGN